MTDRMLIDLDHLDKYVLGDAALRDEILSIFHDQAQTLIARFDVAAGDAEWKDVAHALKGASRGVGAWTIGDLCEQAEELVGDDNDKIKKREAKLSAIQQQTNNALREVIRLREAA